MSTSMKEVGYFRHLPRRQRSAHPALSIVKMGTMFITRPRHVQKHVAIPTTLSDHRYAMKLGVIGLVVNAALGQQLILKIHVMASQVLFAKITAVMARGHV